MGLKSREQMFTFTHISARNVALNEIAEILSEMQINVELRP